MSLYWNCQTVFLGFNSVNQGKQSIRVLQSMEKVTLEIAIETQDSCSFNLIKGPQIIVIVPNLQ